MNKTIFIIESDLVQQKTLKDIFIEEGYNVFTYIKGETALNEIDSKKPDLIMSALLLPGMNGYELCRTLKSNSSTWDIPFIILTCRTDEFDIINCINNGCDEYMTKPYNTNILKAKVRAILSKQDRINAEEKIELKYSNLTINPQECSVLIEKNLIPLTATEFKLLYKLAQNPNQVFSRKQLFEDAHDGSNYYGERSVDILIGRIRKKLGGYKILLKTVHGLGYKFINDTNVLYKLCPMTACIC